MEILREGTKKARVVAKETYAKAETALNFDLGTL
jgi:hypothetical protein